MKRIDASLHLAAVLVLIDNLICGVFIKNSVVPVVGHEGVADGDFVEFIDSFRAAYLGRQMERLAHCPAVTFRLYIHTVRSDAKSIPTFIFRLDRIKGERFAQDYIGPTVTVKLQTIRSILP